MRMLLQACVLLTSQFVAHGVSIRPDINTNIIAGDVDFESRTSLQDDLQNSITRPSYTKGFISPEEITKDIKSQTEETTGASKGITENVVRDMTAEITKTDNTYTDKITPSPKPVLVPGTIDRFSNSILLQGHVFGIRDNVMAMIQMALSSSNTFVPVEPLRVDPIDSSFEEMGYEGDRYTQIRYVVSYNGNPIHTEVITRLMSTPKVAHHFKKQLDKQQLREYKTAMPVKQQSWTHAHLAAVVVPSCIAFVIILVIVFVVARKRSVAASKVEQKKKSCKSNVVSDKKCKPPPYSVDNPAYSYETNAVMEGYTAPSQSQIV